jgi:amino acid adenylation domain-containing protein
MMPRLLQTGFLRSSERFCSRPALEVDNRVISYGELREFATDIAWTLDRYDQSDSSLTAVFGYRSAVAFAGVIGALLRGHGYVPLNRTFPIERTRQMLERSGCGAVVVDEGSALQLEALLAGMSRQLIVLLPDIEDVSKLVAQLPQHRVLGRGDLVHSGEPDLGSTAAADQIAYLLFTSGSTGIPKGVMVAQRNVLSYLDFIVPRYGLTADDRCSQTFDMTFDLSAHDMFVTWEVGACLCCPTQKTLIKPGAFIRNARLTTWFSVPSTVVFMSRFGMLKPGQYENLRLSIFCGEALPVEAVNQWVAAAPNSIVENIYGPTELTIACTAYRWDPARSPGECEQGLVPIGEPFAGMEALIVDDQLREVRAGADGELVMTGPQLSLGYWQDEAQTRQAFVQLPHKTGTYYRTKDRVRRAAPERPMVYLGRLDSQVKILGHRVELGEVEAAVRRAAGVAGVVAVGWPITPSGADGIEVFVESESTNTEAVLADLKTVLPTYMVPRRIHPLGRFPLNVNGKFDRKALVQRLSETA